MKQTRCPSRCGAILVAVLTCLLVASSLVMTAVQSSIRARHTCKDALLIRQTQWLVEAGISRAIEKFRLSNEYHGEVWRPKLSTDNAWNASVQIEEVRPPQPHDSEPSRFKIIAKLESQASPSQSIQKSFQFTVHKDTLSPSEP
jgi:type II secretory pathway component PulK